MPPSWKSFYGQATLSLLNTGTSETVNRQARRLPSGDVRFLLLQESGANQTVWHSSETGAGRPLVLLHGIGMSHAAWNPVVPYLCLTRRVIAFDTAGFGLTPPLPATALPTISTGLAAR